MKKSSKLFSAILAVLLMVSALGTVPANAAEAEVTVNSLPELQEARASGGHSCSGRWGHDPHCRGYRNPGRSEHRDR